MMTEPDRSDIVNDYRTARARLRLAPYDAWLAEHIAGRVARLLDKCDAEDRGGDGQGDGREAGGRAARMTPFARAHANNPPV